jgi:PAS domain S-box-containing protein
MTSTSAVTSAERIYRLLIVEDDEIVQHLYASALAQQAPGTCTIQQAADGAAGLTALRTHSFDCVLLDLRLPDMNGLDFLANAAVDGALPCSFVVVTAQGSEAIAVEAMKRGVADYLVKGRINLDSLWRLIERVVTGADLRRHLAEAARSLEQRSAELLRLNDALGRSEARFRGVVEAAPNAIVMVNAAGEIELVNAQTERLFGYTRSELLGAPAEMLLPARFRTQNQGAWTGIFAKPTPSIGPERPLLALKKDGSEMEVDIWVSSIETDDGVKLLATIVDISDRVRLEEQVRQSMKMHAIGRVTAGVAHDFNNLLLALGGSLEMLLEEVADRPAAMEWGRIALRAATRGKDLTDRLLSFSRQQLLVPRRVLVRDLFGELEKLIGHLFKQDTATATKIVIVPSAPGLAVMADLGQLEAALINLAMNARDAMPSGGCLRFSAYAADADPEMVLPGHYTVISVADTGSGMEADTLLHACDPFFSTKGVAGSGLGLSMVQGFARQSGGEAHISSVPGEGTTIDLWLPSASGASEVVAPVALPAQLAGHVLLVDDSEDSLLVSAIFLRSAGLNVTGKSSGDLALAELAGGKRFDAVVTDFAMPGMSGLELLRRAREIDPSMVGMIITGFSDPEALSQLGEVAMLRKPFNRAELICAVQKLIAAKPSPRGLEQFERRSVGSVASADMGYAQ